MSRYFTLRYAKDMHLKSRSLFITSGNASSSSQRVKGVGENEYEGGVKDRQKEHVRKNEAERKCV